MNKIEIYLSTIFSNCIGFVFNLSFFILYFQFIDSGTLGLGIEAFYIIPIFINLIILSLAFSLILSCIYVLAKDITQVWMVVTGIGFWISPILFKLETFREALPRIDFANPIAGIIINARNAMLYQKAPEWDLFYFDFVYAIILLLVGILMLNKIGSRAAEKL
jgi:ABC-type polysaccharide/polyol phosphate export permease